jgi:hypothetical protein
MIMSPVLISEDDTAFEQDAQHGPRPVYGEITGAELRRVLAQRERQAVESAVASLPEGHSAGLEAAISDADLRAHISERAYRLIVDLETGGRAYYEAPRGINKRPVWPGGSSGVTIGCGYDLGYHTQAEFNSAWSELLEARHVALLNGAIGKKGPAARNFMPRVAHIVVEWGTALAVFDAVTISKYPRLMLHHLPTAIELPGDCFGALVSLVFNRGPSFRLAGDRYREMREIARLMAAREFDGVPDQILSMKRLWEGAGLGGLLIRRDKEADMFQDGLDARRMAAQDATLRQHISASSSLPPSGVEVRRSSPTSAG